MMLRRSFLKRMAFAALATVLPEIPLPRKPTAWYDPEAQVYGLGFAVTSEMLEDDLYRYNRADVELVRALREELDRELTLRFRVGV